MSSNHSCGPAARAGRVRAPSRRLRPAIEPAEGRVLMSVAHPFAAGAAAGAPGLTEFVINGEVKKVPAFSNEYGGPKLPSLNAVTAGGKYVPGVGFVFSGSVAGPIDPSVPAHYVFLVNRGGSKGFGPYMKRSNLVFDAEVDVSVGPTGVTGQVYLLPTQPVTLATVELPPGGPGLSSALSGSGIAPFAPIKLSDPSTTPTAVEPLPASNVVVSGKNVAVIVPAGFLPTTAKNLRSPILNLYSFDFSVQLALNQSSQIASFAPEYNMNALAIPKAPHRRH